MNRRVTWSRLGTSPPFPGDVLPFCFTRPSLRRWTTSRSCQWASSASTSGTSRRGREPPRQQAHARLGVPACCLWLPVPLARSAVIMALAAGPGIHLPNIFATPIAPVALPARSDPACVSVAFARSLPGLASVPAVQRALVGAALMLGVPSPPALAAVSTTWLLRSLCLHAGTNGGHAGLSGGWVASKTQTGVASLLAPTPPQRHRSSLRCVSHRVRQSEHPAAVFNRRVVHRAVPSAVMPHGARRVIRTCVIVMSHLETTVRAGSHPLVCTSRIQWCTLYY